MASREVYTYVTAMWRAGSQLVWPLVSIAMVVAPVGQRWHIECADGSPCGRPAVRTCCHPHSCQPTPADSQCVIRATAAVDRVNAAVATVDLKAQPVAVLPVIDAIIPPAEISRRDRTQNQHPPDNPSPKLGQAPRAPPAGDC